MGVMLKSEIRQDRRMSLLLSEEVKTDRLERIVGELVTELGLDSRTSTLRAPLRVWPAFIGS
jgi:hypothetical protein